MRWRGEKLEASTILHNLGDQRAYSHVERERAKVASVGAVDDVEAARLIAALRDVTSGGTFGVG
ncbi:hypothetical protein GCM10028801_43460 [Nocardioides maradonensis]